MQRLVVNLNMLIKQKTDKKNILKDIISIYFEKYILAQLIYDKWFSQDLFCKHTYYYPNM